MMQDKSVLAFFPTPYPDELLYSILARYHIRSGNLSSKLTIEELFNSKTVTAVADMPSGLDILISRIPFKRKITSSDLIMGYTLYPYYTMFLPEDRVKAVARAMWGNRGNAINNITGMMASAIHFPRHLRFCPECFVEDTRQFGEAYWHRLHQIPGVLMCTKHKKILIESSVDMHFHRYEFVAANEQNCIYSSSNAIYKDSDLLRILQYAEDIVWCLSNYGLIRKVFISNHNLRDCYLAILKEKNFATVGGRVYQDDLKECFNEFYGNVYLRLLQSDCQNGESWLSAIVRKHRKTFHPIRHLLMIRFLLGSPENFFSRTWVYLPFGKGPWPCLNAASEHYKQPVIKEIRITHCSDTKRPVGTFVCSCGFVYSRRGPDAVKNDLYRIGRIKSFGSVWEEKLRNLAVKEKWGICNIAKALNVDRGTVLKYISKLNIASVKQKNITNNHFYDLRSQHRSAWLDVQKFNMTFLKTEIRKLAPKHYTWLYRHDKEWLNRNSPKPKSVKCNNHRVDWDERDRRLLYEAEQAVKDILKNQKPVRVTISRIGKMIGALALLEKNLNKLPLTKAYLMKARESKTDFRKRRFCWAINAIKDSGEQLDLWSVLRKAGIRPEYMRDFSEIIFHEFGLQS